MASIDKTEHNSHQGLKSTGECERIVASVKSNEPPVFKALSSFLAEYAWDKSLLKQEKVA